MAQAFGSPPPSPAWPGGGPAFATPGTPSSVIPQLQQYQRLAAIARSNPDLLKSMPNVPVDLLPKGS
jgi:hypothetical protein